MSEEGQHPGALDVLINYAPPTIDESRRMWCVCVAAEIAPPDKMLALARAVEVYLISGDTPTPANAKAGALKVVK